MSEISKIFTIDKYVATYSVEHSHEGWRLDQFVQFCVPNLSRQYLKSKIEKGEVEIIGRKPPHKPSVKVHAKEIVIITTHNDSIDDDEHWHGSPVPKDEEPGIVYEDENLMVINKPPFMLTHPAGKNLFYCATVWYETRFKKPIHTIHRIDRETTGLLLLAKNPRTAEKIINLFEKDQIRKCYLFISKKNEVRTALPFTAKERMDRDDNRIPQGIISWWSEDSQLGKEAQTHFEEVMDLGNYVIALAFPVTGRQHQIRVHASAHGYPLLGDKLYNGDSSIFMRFKDGNPTQLDHTLMEIPRQALHAVALKLTYPANEYTHFVSPIPKDLGDWLTEKFNVDLELLDNKVRQIVEEKFKENK